MKVGVYSFEDGKEPKDLEKQIKVLNKQLDVAEEALKQYADETVWLTGYDALGNGGIDCMFYCNGYETAQKALEQIKELDK